MYTHTHADPPKKIFFSAPYKEKSNQHRNLGKRKVSKWPPPSHENGGKPESYWRIIIKLISISSWLFHRVFNQIFCWEFVQLTFPSISHTVLERSPWFVNNGASLPSNWKQTLKEEILSLIAVSQSSLAELVFCLRSLMITKTIIYDWHTSCAKERTERPSSNLH